MLSFHKINPMVRAIGTVGAVAALVGGITFAAQNASAVKLTDNTIATETATLAIQALGTNTLCPTDGDNSYKTSDKGMKITNLSESTPQTFKFCLDNQGSAPTSILMTSPAIITTSTGLSPSDITLTVKCGTNGAVGGTLDTYGTSDGYVVDTGLGATTSELCTATASLSTSYTGSGGTVNSFELDFAGTLTS